MDGLAGGVGDGQPGQIAVVLRAHGHGGALPDRSQNDRSGVVNVEVIADHRAAPQHVLHQKRPEGGIGQRAGGRGGEVGIELHRVVFGNRVVADADALALGAVVGDLRAGGVGPGGSALPGGGALAVVHAARIRGGNGGVPDARDGSGLVDRADCIAGCAGGTDQIVLDLRDGVGGAKRQFFSREGALRCVGIAGHVRRGPVAAIGHVVRLGLAGVGDLARSVDVLVHVGGVVEHGGVGPGAVKAQNGDGVLHVQLLAVGGDGAALDEGVALKISAGRVAGVKFRHVLRHGDRDLDGFG